MTSLQHNTEVPQSSFNNNDHFRCCRWCFHSAPIFIKMGTGTLWLQKKLENRKKRNALYEQIRFWRSSRAIYSFFGALYNRGSNFAEGVPNSVYISTYTSFTLARKPFCVQCKCISEGLTPLSMNPAVVTGIYRLWLGSAVMWMSQLGEHAYLLSFLRRDAMMCVEVKAVGLLIFFHLSPSSSARTLFSQRCFRKRDWS